jgi:hypothetical protein
MFQSLRHVVQSLVWLLVVLAASTFVFGGRVDTVRLVMVYVGVTLALAALTYLQRPNPRVREGWHYLSPSAMEWFGLVGSFGLTLLLLWIYHFVGSARADAGTQMIALKLHRRIRNRHRARFLHIVCSELPNDHMIEQPTVPPGQSDPVCRCRGRRHEPVDPDDLGCRVGRHGHPLHALRQRRGNAGAHDLSARARRSHALIPLPAATRGCGYLGVPMNPPMNPPASSASVPIPKFVRSRGGV